ncbi:MAG: TonB family protein [candidate division Zixibacteria bacterium]|nr:TonB family protein [candidate division Zixibacteria bacterium]
MNCREFEYKLWENPQKYADRKKLPAELANHMKDCRDCRQVYADYLGLIELSDQSKIVKDDEYWQKFETKVFSEINRLESTQQPESVKKSVVREITKRPEIAFKHLIFSLGAAAAAILLIFIAISDIAKQMQLPQASRAKGDSLPISAPLTQNVPSVFKVNLAGGIHLQEFSILAKPEVEEFKDSALVAIDAVYLTDKGIKNENIKIARALSEEVVMGTSTDLSHISDEKPAEQRIRTSRAFINESKKQRAENEISPQKHKAIEMEAGRNDWVITLEKMPTMKIAVAPTYPPLAFKLKKQGEVWIKARVDTEGKVVEAFIYRGSIGDYGFDEEALKAAYKNEFEPLEIDNKKLPVWVIYKVRFVIKE